MQVTRGKGAIHRVVLALVIEAVSVEAKSVRITGRFLEERSEAKRGGEPKARTEGEREEEEGGRVREGKEARG